MAGSNVNDQSGQHCCGVTPLHDAAENGHLDVVKLLLSYGASTNLKDSKVCMKVYYDDTFIFHDLLTQVSKTTI